MSRLLTRLLLSLRPLAIRLASWIVPPGMLLLDDAMGMMKTRLLELAVDLDIALILEKQGPLGAKALAAKVSANAEALHRVLRALASMGVFRLRPDGRFANNRLSRALIPGRKGSVASSIKYFSSEASTRAWLSLSQTVATGQSAFTKAHGVGVWDFFLKNPEQGTEFGLAMRELTELEASAIAKGYPFGAFESICDVGGGSGALLKEVLKHHPKIDAFVYDRADENVTAGLSSIRRVSGSFFDTVPSGPDAYLLKDILHDWDDENALRILKNVRKAMSPGTALLVIEMLLEPTSLEPEGIAADLHMLVICQGKQRTHVEMESLLKEAGFSIDRVIGLPSAYSIVEARAKA